MAEIIPFDDLVRARRRDRERESAQRCVELIELNLQVALQRFATASLRDRQVWARRIHVLSELLEYAVRI